EVRKTKEGRRTEPRAPSVARTAARRRDLTQRAGADRTAHAAQELRQPDHIVAAIGAQGARARVEHGHPGAELSPRVHPAATLFDAVLAQREAGRPQTAVGMTAQEYEHRFADLVLRPAENPFLLATYVTAELAQHEWARRQHAKQLFRRFDRHIGMNCAAVGIGAAVDAR